MKIKFRPDDFNLILTVVTGGAYAGHLKKALRISFSFVNLRVLPESQVYKLKQQIAPGAHNKSMYCKLKIWFDSKD